MIVTGLSGAAFASSSADPKLRVREVDDGAVALVVIVAADLARVPALQESDGTVAEGCGFPVAPYRGVEATRAGRTTAGRSAERRR